MGCMLFIPYSLRILANGTLSLANKPRGLQAARKLRNDRRENRWVCFVNIPAKLQTSHLQIIGGQSVQETGPR